MSETKRPEGALSPATGYASCAKWPDGTVTRDEHFRDTETRAHDAAAAVVRGLRLNGFGGDKRVFPVGTWIEPVMRHNDEAERTAIAETARQPEV